MTAFHTFSDEPSGDSHAIAGLEQFDFPKYDASKEPAPPAALVELAANPKPLKFTAADGTLWYRQVNHLEHTHTHTDAYTTASKEGNTFVWEFVLDTTLV